MPDSDVRSRQFACHGAGNCGVAESHNLFVERFGEVSMPWRDGFFEIDLSDVPVSDLQSDWAVSKNYTREQMQEWIEHLAAIQEMRDQGATHEDFQQMRTSSDPNERGLGSTYHNFYDHERTGPKANSDHLKVEWNDDRYEI